MKTILFTALAAGVSAIALSSTAHAGGLIGGSAGVLTSGHGNVAGGLSGQTMTSLPRAGTSMNGALSGIAGADVQGSGYVDRSLIDKTQGGAKQAAQQGQAKAADTVDTGRAAAKATRDQAVDTSGQVQGQAQSAAQGAAATTTAARKVSADTAAGANGSNGSAGTTASASPRSVNAGVNASVQGSAGSR